MTRDRGANVLYTGTVPAGLTAMQALTRVRKVKTRYGGRFVQSIDGLDGSATRQQDWFFFVDGIEGDRSAAEVKLRPGDVEWWDYRHWTGATMSVPVVAGAYPQPFLRGSTSVLRGRRPPVGRDLDRRAGARRVGSRTERANSIVISSRFPPEHVRIGRFGDGVQLELGAAIARRLAANPPRFASASESRREPGARSAPARGADRRRAARARDVAGRRDRARCSWLRRGGRPRRGAGHTSSGP